jgi:hypothetical protein
VTARRIGCAAWVVVAGIARAFFLHVAVCVMGAVDGLLRGGHHRVMQHARVRVHSKTAQEGG